MLANAISIDGRKECTCKFCSESNVWTRRRCRLSYSNIPGGVAREAQTGGRREGLFNAERGGRQKDAELGSREQGAQKSCRRSYEMSKDCHSSPRKESIKESLQDQLQEVEERRHDLMPEHQKVQK